MRRRNVVWIMVLLPMLSVISAAWAEDHKHDHERARTLLEKGVILPLSEIVRLVSERYPGKILDVDLEEEDGEIIYEIELLGENGVVMEMDVDARTGRMISVEED